MIARRYSAACSLTMRRAATRQTGSRWQCSSRTGAAQLAGGLWGRTGYGWLFAEFLVVPDELRGHDLGTKLMDDAESIAIERSCVGAWLTAFSFQARSFYEKRGYTALDELPNSPDHNVRIFMSKRLSASSPAP